MPRNYVRKTNRQSWDPENMRKALEKVKNGMPLKTASKIFSVPVMSLKRRARGKNSIATNDLKVLGSKVGVFSAEQEQQLVNHIRDFESRMYGITARDLRKLAYQFAEKNYIPHKFSHEAQAAGKEWLYGFQKRHPTISFRSPEATTAVRATAFNPVPVTKFFNLLKEVLAKNNYPPHRIFNVDETLISTIPGVNSKIFAKKGRKHIARRGTSIEYGESTTVVLSMSADGAFVPPMLIFNRKNVEIELMKGAPPGTIFMSDETGWRRLEVFSSWFEHFISFIKPTENEPALLILDDYLSHTKNLNVLQRAKENFITILCLPPYCSHKLQPLEVGVIFPLSTYMDQALERWMNNNPGTTVTAFEISQVFCEAYLKATTISNCLNGFQKTGIYPYNPEIFINDIDFIAIDVKDELFDDEYQQQNHSMSSQLDSTPINDNLDNPQPGPSSRPDNYISITEIKFQIPDSISIIPEVKVPDSIPITPEVKISSSIVYRPIEYQPVPKREEKQNTTKRKCALTSTSNKQAVKKRKTDVGKGKKGIGIVLEEKTVKGKKFAPKKKIIIEKSCSSASDDEDIDIECIYCCVSSFDSTKRGFWIQCITCRKWAHEQCASKQ